MPHAKEEKPDKKPNKKKKEKRKDDSQAGISKQRKQKKFKKSICISYSPDSSFTEKKFVCDFVHGIKENNLADDIWFDKDEGIVNDPSWLTLRLEAVDRCRAAIMLISRDYMSCPVSLYESKIILERLISDDESKRPRVFCILLEPVSLPRSFTESLSSARAGLVDLTGDLEHLPLAEKTSFAVGALIEKLDEIASIKTPYVLPTIERDPEFTGAYQGKHVVHWSSNDVVEWLYSIGIREFYRQSFSEQFVDGYLLLATMDSELLWTLGVDSKITRKKISNQLLQVLEREQKLEGNWHLRARITRPRQDHVYMIYDPQDVRLASNLNTDLTRRGLKVLTHEKLGQSRAEFLQLNGAILAQCSHVICILTDAAAASPFAFHEVLFSCWLGGRTMVSAVFKNVWEKLKNPIKAALGDALSVDFETKLYSDSMDVLEHHLRPPEKIAGVVLEQAYLDRMTEALQPLRILATRNADVSIIKTTSPFEQETMQAKVFISYQWDMQAKVLEIADHLQANGMPCWADMTVTTRPSLSRMSVRTTSSAASNADIMQSETLKSHIQRNMKAASVVLCCVTPQYSNSANCEQDLALAVKLNKLILPVMLRFVSWPPEGSSERVRRLMARLPKPVDMSNEKLYRANFGLLTEKISQCVNQVKIPR